MTYSTRSLLVLALAVCMVLPVVSAADIDITVTVYNKHGDEIEDAHVIMYNSSDDDFDCGYTDGEVECDNIDDEGDDFTIKVTHADYETIDESDTSLDNLDNDDAIVVIMRPKDDYELTVKVEDNSKENVEDVDLKLECIEEDMDKEDFEAMDDSFDEFDKFVFPDGKDDYEACDYVEEGKTGSDGEYTFDNLEYNAKYKLTAEKNDFITTVWRFNFSDDDIDDNDDLKVVIIEPGEATFIAVVRDRESGDFIDSATVTVVDRETGAQETEQTAANGRATLTLETPACYYAAVTKEGYSTDSNEAPICLEVDGATWEMPFELISQNNPPTAEAGDDQYVILGNPVTLDASASSDPDGDELSYAWEDSLGEELADGETVTVTFETAGEHVITLTVTDAKDETSTDEVRVVVEAPENCGDSVCSLAEDATGSCPEDCPICMDEICGAGEATPNSSLYCPYDCGLALDFELAGIISQDAEITVGNSTTITVIDPLTGEPIAANVTITPPSGNVTFVQTADGTVQYSFEEAGEYEIRVDSARYVSYSSTFELKSPMDLSWLLWLVIVVAIIIAVLFAIRFMNLKRGGGSGYRANKYRRSKPTLSKL